MARAMKDSGIEWIGEIPEGWESKRLKYLVSYNDESLGEDTNPDYEFDYIDIGSVEYGKGITQYQHMRFADSPSRARRVVHDKDVILSTVRTYLKAVATIDDRDNPQIASTGFVVLRAKQGQITPDYLHYSVLSNAFVSLVEAKSTGISYPAINASEVVEIKIPVPKISEQKRIADYLDSECARIDAVIDQTRATIEEYKKLKQSVITQAVTKGIRPGRKMKDSGVEWIDSIPEEWSMERGKGLFIEVDNRSEDGIEELLTVSQYTGITPRSQKNVNMFEAETLEGYKICEIGDIAANTMWLWAGAIGVSNYRGVISPSYNIYRQKGENYDSTYLDFLLRAAPLVQHYESLSSGIRASRLRLYPQQFLSIRYPVPPMSEQKEIVSYLKEKIDDIDSLIQKKGQYLAEIESYKKSFIFEYVTGKKEVI